jgi:hypothetical protein
MDWPVTVGRDWDRMMVTMEEWVELLGAIIPS